MCLTNSSTSKSKLNNNQNKKLSILNDETMPIIADVQSLHVSNIRKRSKSTRTSLVVYGPICVRKRHTKAPTLATGRRSKDAIIEGEDPTKREIRRQKNRESARNLKKLRDNIEQDLEKQISQLEFHEHHLLSEVNKLQIYKQYLENQCQQTHSIYEIIARTTSAVLSELRKQRQTFLQNVSIEPKQEPRSPSPQWQLLFHI